MLSKIRGIGQSRTGQDRLGPPRCSTSLREVRLFAPVAVWRPSDRSVPQRFRCPASRPPSNWRSRHVAPFPPSPSYEEGCSRGAFTTVANSRGRSGLRVGPLWAIGPWSRKVPPWEGFGASRPARRALGLEVESRGPPPTPTVARRAPITEPSGDSSAARHLKYANLSTLLWGKTSAPRS